MRVPHVLVVEDDPVTANVVRAVVTRQGATVTVLGNGLDAVDYLSGSPPWHLNPFPSLVVLDLGLPGADGFEVLGWMSASRLLRVAPVIVFSASADPADQRLAMELGARVFLRKPADPVTLAHAVQELLRHPGSSARSAGDAG